MAEVWSSEIIFNLLHSRSDEHYLTNERQKAVHVFHGLMLAFHLMWGGNRFSPKDSLVLVRCGVIVAFSKQVFKDDRNCDRQIWPMDIQTQPLKAFRKVCSFITTLSSNFFPENKNSHDKNNNKKLTLVWKFGLAKVHPHRILLHCLNYRPRSKFEKSYLFLANNKTFCDYWIWMNLWLLWEICYKMLDFFVLTNYIQFLPLFKSKSCLNYHY